MKKALVAIVSSLAIAGTAGVASANLMNLHFEEWELGGAFTYTHSIIDYELGTTVTIRPGSWNEITVSSGAGSGGWDYQLVVDYTSYCLGCLNPGGSAYVTASNLQDELEVATAAGSFGTVSYSDSTISWNATASSMIFNNGMLTLSWNSSYVPPVPAPGAVALLGLAGLVGAGRRRR
jgi:hypothetical protein